MIEYRITTHNDKILNEFWKEDWQLIQILDNKMYWSRVVKKTITSSIWEKTKEWIEFRDKYKTIKNSWLSANSLIVKYNKLCKEWLHSKVMANLEDYVTYLEVKKKKDYALMAQTYINQERYKDEWEIIEDMSRKFINDIFKEKKLNADEIEFMTKEIEVYEKTQNREASDFNVRSIIKKYLNK